MPLTTEIKLIVSFCRRLGLGAELMNQLHHHMSSNHNVNSVGLHVRVSNIGATKLYRENMGYRVAKTIKGYYHDGEDAYLMKKALPSAAATNKDGKLKHANEYIEKIIRKNNERDRRDVIPSEVFALPRLAVVPAGASN